MIEADIHPLASRELEDAAKFYEKQAPNLGRRFLDTVQRAIEHILLFPESSPVVGSTVRQKTIGRFPYNILYTLEKGEILFVAIAHQKRRPMYWKNRIPS